MDRSVVLNGYKMLGGVMFLLMFLTGCDKNEPERDVIRTSYGYDCSVLARRRGMVRDAAGRV